MIKKLSLISKKTILFYLLSLCGILCVFYYGAFIDYKDVIFLADNSEVKKSLGLTIFYTTLTTGNYIYTTIIFLILLPNLYVIKAVINKMTGFDKFIITRVGIKKYISKIYLLNIMITFLFSFISLVCILFLIHFRYVNIAFDFEYEHIAAIAPNFSDNSILDLTYYILLSSIGYSIFSSFLFGICYFTKNKYLVRSMGIIIGIIFLLAAAIIGQMLSVYINVNVLVFLTAPFYVPYIITPGLESLAGAFNNYPPILFYFISIIGVSLFSYVLYVYIREDMKKYG